MDHLITTILNKQTNGELWVELIANSEADRDIINQFADAIENLPGIGWSRHYYLNCPVGTVPDDPPYTRFGSYAFTLKVKNEPQI